MSIIKYFGLKKGKSFNESVCSVLFYSKILSKSQECSNIRSSVNHPLFEPL